MESVNEYGVPRRCASCPRIFPTLERLKSLENEKFVYDNYSIATEEFSTKEHSEKRRRQIEIEISATLTILGALTEVIEGCKGAVPTQLRDEEGHTINTIHCGLDE